MPTIEELIEPSLADAQALLQQAPVAIAVLSGPEHRFALANGRYAELVCRDDLLGRCWADVFPELRDTALPEILAEVYRTGQPYAAREMRVPLRRHGRSEDAFFRFNLVAQRDPAGKVGGIMVVANEVTDEVRSRHALEVAFRDRQRLLVELDRASRTKHEFLAMLGHELRNPVAPIVSALELMALKEGGDTRWEQDVIRRQVKQLTRLLDDLMGTGSVLRGHVTLQREPIEVGDLLAEAVDMAGPSLKAHDHRVTTTVEAGRLACRGDPVRLAQAVANLLNNAARYTPRGGRIELSARRDGDAAHITVSDDGRGIPADVLPHIFELFYQGPQSPDRSEGGMGVGLTVARNLVEMHGGSVCAHSDGPGRGACFTVRLPRMTEVDAVVTTRDPVGELSGEPLPARPRRILVVDDNADAADALAELLRLDGHQATVATSAQQALNLLPRVKPDVALLDIGLPGMNGYDLGVQIRQRMGARACRLFAVTGYAEESDRRRSAQLGFVDHLIKPVDHDRLLQQLGRLDLPVAQ
jgi:signal transduction histidine kinase